MRKRFAFVYCLLKPGLCLCLILAPLAAFGAQAEASPALVSPPVVAGWQLSPLALLWLLAGGLPLCGWIMARILGKERVEKLQLEARLQETDSLYRSIFENATTGVFRSSPDGRLLTVNETLARIYGYGSSQELIAKISDIALYEVDPEIRASG